MAKQLILIALTLSALIGGCSKPEFQLTLTSLTEYAKTLPEYPLPDNVDWLNPDYTSLYRKDRPGAVASWFNSFLSNFGFQETKREELIFFDMLESSLKKKNPQFFKRSHVVALRPRVGAQIFVFGDSNGAFHSLLRDFEELKKRNIIDNEFNIKKDNVYFVFNGNQIDRSPYSLQALFLIMALQLKNEDRVIYVAGRHEINDTWRDYSTWRQIWAAYCEDLNLKCTKDGTGVPKGSEQLSSYFRTLPLALYVLDSRESEPRAMKFYGHEKTVEDAALDRLIEMDAQYSEKPLAKFLDEEHLAKSKPVKIDVVFRAQSRSLSYRISNGLERLEPEDGAISWSSLSSPVLANRELFGFKNDAFLEINVNSQTNKSTVSLHAQNADTKLGFNTTTYHILSGKELSSEELQSPPLIDDYYVAFGSTFDLTGVASTLGQRILSGINLRIRKKNRNDEQSYKVNLDFQNKLLRFYVTNDRSRADLAHKNIDDLVNKRGVRSILVPAGIGTIESISPQIEDGSLSVFFPNSGTASLRRPELKGLINLRTSFANETCALIRYAREEMKKSKFAIAYQDDQFGRETKDTAIKFLKDKYRLMEGESICAIPYKPDTLDLDEPAAKIKECYPNALLFVATYSAADAIVKRIGTESLSEVLILGLSHVSDAFASEADSSGAIEKRTGLNVAVSRVVPNPQDTSYLIVQRYREEMDKEYKGAKYNTDSFEAYIGTSLLIRTMENMQDPTREKLIQKFENLKNDSHQGLELNFNPKTRELMDELWLDTGAPQWVNFKSANTLCDVARDTNKFWDDY